MAEFGKFQIDTKFTCRLAFSKLREIYDTEPQTGFSEMDWDNSGYDVDKCQIISLGRDVLIN